MKKKILYISGSIGLGHITSDMAIARKIREIDPAIEITWLAAHPATLALESRGERLHPYSERFSSYSASAESASSGSELNLVKYAFGSSLGWMRNVLTFRRLISEATFDLVVANETYEIMIALIFRLIKVKMPFVMIYDFLGLETMTRNPLERLGNYILSWIWSRDHTVCSKPGRMALFIGEPEDIPDRRFGLFLPNRRAYARRHYRFIGHVLLFDPLAYRDKGKIRGELDYGDEPLIICSIGGTSIGRELLELCGRAYPIIREKIPGARMILVTGPRLERKGLEVPAGVEIRGFVPELYKHFAACDIAVVQGGLTSTLELSALERPFIYFPIEGHSEQEEVAERLARHKAGVRLALSQTSPQILAEQVLLNLGREVDYIPIPVEGASKAARLISGLLSPPADLPNR